MKFKEDQLVRISPNLKIGNEYGGMRWTEMMNDLLGGHFVRITYYDSVDKTYLVEYEDSCYWVGEDCIESTDETEEENMRNLVFVKFGHSSEKTYLYSAPMYTNIDAGQHLFVAVKDKADKIAIAADNSFKVTDQAFDIIVKNVVPEGIELQKVTGLAIKPEVPYTKVPF